LALLALALPACDSDDPSDGEDPGDLELITEVEITLTPSDGSDDILLTAIDEDGDGIGIEYIPALTTLDAGLTYAGSIRLTDASGASDVDVTADIRAEADAHLFRFDFSGVSGLDSLSAVATDSESDYLEEDQGFEDYAVGYRHVRRGALSLRGGQRESK
jgi:hypothetical protein